MTTTTSPAVIRAMAVTALWDHAADAMDALYALQCTPLWATLPLATRRVLCAARFQCQVVTDAIDAEDEA
jgi:hypothetical protein